MSEVHPTEPNPGTQEAIDAGCQCPVLDNRHGRGFYAAEGRGFYAAEDGVFCYTEGCPIHWPAKEDE